MAKARTYRVQFYKRFHRRQDVYVSITAGADLREVARAVVVTAKAQFDDHWPDRHTPLRCVGIEDVATGRKVT